jgi:cell division protein FtsL
MRRTQKSANEKISEWVDQGLKKVRWSLSFVTRVALIIVIVAAFAVLYLVQSSQLVTSVRHLQQLQSDLIQLQQDNAQLALEISAAGSVTRLQTRAAQLGFGPADEVVYLQVKSQPVDDAPTLESAFAH